MMVDLSARKATNLMVLRTTVAFFSNHCLHGFVDFIGSTASVMILMHASAFSGLLISFE